MGTRIYKRSPPTTLAGRGGKRPVHDPSSANLRRGEQTRPRPRLHRPPSRPIVRQEAPARTEALVPGSPEKRTMPMRRRADAADSSLSLPTRVLLQSYFARVLLQSYFEKCTVYTVSRATSLCGAALLSCRAARVLRRLSATWLDVSTHGSRRGTAGGAGGITQEKTRQATWLQEQAQGAECRASCAT